MSAGRELERAKEAMAKAEAAKNRWTLFSGNSKYEEAAQHYENASNLFRVGRDMHSAGKALLQAAEMQIKCSNMFEATQSYIKAANAFRKEDPGEAVRCLRMAIGLASDAGRFSIAARHQQEVGEILESQLELEEAINAYEIAAEFHDGDNKSSEAGKCLLKVAQFSAQLEKYERAIEIFEQVGKAYLNNSLLKFSARALLLKGGLCHLANGDLVGAQRALDRYKEMDPTFPAQRECKFLEGLMKSIAESQINDFSTICANYDSITPFDAWMTTILLRIKNKIFVPPSGILPPSSSSPSHPSAGPVVPSLPDDLS